MSNWAVMGTKWDVTQVSAHSAEFGGYRRNSIFLPLFGKALGVRRHKTSKNLFNSLIYIKIDTIAKIVKIVKFDIIVKVVKIEKRSNLYKLFQMSKMSQLSFSFNIDKTVKITPIFKIVKKNWIVTIIKIVQIWQNCKKWPKL